MVQDWLNSGSICICYDRQINVSIVKQCGWDLPATFIFPNNPKDGLTFDLWPIKTLMIR
jgi:hypothetical protein